MHTSIQIINTASPLQPFLSQLALIEAGDAARLHSALASLSAGARNAFLGKTPRVGGLMYMSCLGILVCWLRPHTDGSTSTCSRLTHLFTFLIIFFGKIVLSLFCYFCCSWYSWQHYNNRKDNNNNNSTIAPEKHSSTHLKIGKIRY